MATEAAITVTVVRAPKARETMETTLMLEEGATVMQALQALEARDLARLTGAAAGAATQAVGGEPGTDCSVWGKKVGLTHVLRDLDRLEVCRALTVDPKVARRERFAGQGAKKAAGLFAKRRAGAKAGY